MTGCPISGIDLASVCHSPALWIGAAAVAVNVPLGFLRSRTRTYSPAWFVWVHLSVPAIAYLRIRSRVSLWLIPAFIVCAVAGQLLGGTAGARGGKPAAPLPPPRR
ncbi:MAG: hypothetical protein HY927_11795 [Elusimicrobia bacterium]|nr:hypothetical protein [Elusimicrobiota bacterium]